MKWRNQFAVNFDKNTIVTLEKTCADFIYIYFTFISNYINRRIIVKMENVCNESNCNVSTGMTLIAQDFKLNEWSWNLKDLLI